MGVHKSEIDRWKAKWSTAFRAENPSLEGPTAALGASCGAFEAKTDPIQPKSPLAAKFEEMWFVCKGPALVPEHRFDPKRKWRFDYAIPKYHLAIELEGGIHQRKGHGSPEGYKRDCRKYNAAAADGWRVFRLASGMITPEDVGFVACTFHRIILEHEADF